MGRKWYWWARNYCYRGTNIAHFKWEDGFSRNGRVFIQDRKTENLYTFGFNVQVERWAYWASKLNTYIALAQLMMGTNLKNIFPCLEKNRQSCFFLFLCLHAPQSPHLHFQINRIILYGLHSTMIFVSQSDSHVWNFQIYFYENNTSFLEISNFRNVSWLFPYPYSWFLPIPTRTSSRIILLKFNPYRFRSVLRFSKSSRAHSVFRTHYQIVPVSRRYTLRTMGTDRYGVRYLYQYFGVWWIL